MLSLLLGTLASSFVNFGIIGERPEQCHRPVAFLLPASLHLAAQEIKAGNATPEQIQQLHEAATHFKHDAARQAGWLTLIGVVAFFATSLYMIIWTWTGEKNARRIRELYFKAILRQEIAYFDKLGAGEVTTRIQTDTRSCFGLIQPRVSPDRQFIHRLNPARHLRKNPYDYVVYRSFFYGVYSCVFSCAWIRSSAKFLSHSRLCAFMEARACHDFHSSLYRHHWSYHAEIPLWLHQVRCLYSLPDIEANMTWLFACTKYKDEPRSCRTRRLFCRRSYQHHSHRKSLRHPISTRSCLRLARRTILHC